MKVQRKTSVFSGECGGVVYYVFCNDVDVANHGMRGAFVPYNHGCLRSEFREPAATIVLHTHLRLLDFVWFERR